MLPVLPVAQFPHCCTLRPSGKPHVYVPFSCLYGPGLHTARHAGFSSVNPLIFDAHAPCPFNSALIKKKARCVRNQKHSRCTSLARIFYEIKRDHEEETHGRRRG